MDPILLINYRLHSDFTSSSTDVLFCSRIQTRIPHSISCLVCSVFSLFPCCSWHFCRVLVRCFVEHASVWAFLICSHHQIGYVFQQETHRNDVMSFSGYHLRYTRRMSMGLIAADVNFVHWLRWWLLGFSTVMLLFFPLKLISTLRKILWDCATILFLLKLLPTTFCIHQWRGRAPDAHWAQELHLPWTPWGTVVF